MDAIKITLTKSEVAFIHRRLQGMTFYEQNIAPKIANAIPSKIATVLGTGYLPYIDKDRNEPETISEMILCKD